MIGMTMKMISNVSRIEAQQEHDRHHHDHKRRLRRRGRCARNSCTRFFTAHQRKSDREDRCAKQDDEDHRGMVAVAIVALAQTT